MTILDSTPHRIPTGVAPVSLDDISRRTTELWTIEPQVPSVRRTELLADLHELESDLDALLLRTTAGIDVHPAHVRQCAQRYLWLRQQWGDHEVAA